MSVVKKLEARHPHIVVDEALLRQVETFIYREARLADERRYREWEELWADDGIYWVPAKAGDYDPDESMSVIYDNRSRISLRVNQFYTGKRFTQDPASELRRLVTNIEVLDVEGDEVLACCNVAVYESTQRRDVTWVNQTTYRLRKSGDSYKIVLKKVSLVNAGRDLYTMSFLI